MSHTEMARDIHASNVLAGWWSDLQTGESILETRNRGELMMLVVSELCEAACGTDQPDDKLPEYLMFDVELGDTAIRLYDMLGAEAAAIDEADFAVALAECFEGFRWLSVQSQLLQIIVAVSAAMEAHRKGRVDTYVEMLTNALAGVFGLAALRRVDLQKVIADKRAFNAQRADHKVENRRAAGGKAY